MQRIHRRDILRTAGAGAGLALGTTTAAGDTIVTGESSTSRAHAVTDDQLATASEVVTTFTATATSGRIGIDIDDPEIADTFTAEDIPDDRDVLIEFEGELLETGAWRAEEVTLPDLTDVLEIIEVTQALEDFLAGLDLEAVLEDIDADSFIEGVVSFVDTIDFDEAQAESIRSAFNDVLEDLTNIPGVIGLVEDAANIDLITILTEPTVRDWEFFLTGISDAVALFDGGLSTDETLVEDDIDPDGPLEVIDLISGLLGLADLSIPELQDELVSAFEGLDDEDLAELFDLLDIALEPGPVGGTFDPRPAIAGDADALVTAEVDTATVNPSIDIGGLLSAPSSVQPSIIDIGLDEVDVIFDMSFTSAESDTQTGSLDIDDNTAMVTLVDNEFVADLDKLDLAVLLSELGVDDLLSAAFDLLDLEEELDDLFGDFLDLNFGEIIADIDIVSLIGGLGLVDLVADQITDESGRHVLEFDFVFEFDDLDLEILQDGLPQDPVGANERPPRDLTGEGLFGDINGDGEFDVTDVQTLFENLRDPAIQDTPAQFNFSRTNPDRVTVFDVQALFTRLD